MNLGKEGLFSPILKMIMVKQRNMGTRSSVQGNLLKRQKIEKKRKKERKKEKKEKTEKGDTKVSAEPGASVSSIL